jgi:hypothetical protein
MNLILCLLFQRVRDADASHGRSAPGLLAPVVGRIVTPHPVARQGLLTSFAGVRLSQHGNPEPQTVDYA